MLAPPTERSVQVTPSALTRIFWDGCAREELLFQRCNSCETVNFDPTVRCRACLARDLRWERSAGRGTIASWTMVWRPVEPSYTVPYAPAIVELDEGYHIATNIVGCDHAEICTGLRVVVTFHRDREGFTLPYFTPE